ncbi:hypothetical protein EMCRGX_G012421 [Ephydatia muelleri]
MPCCPNARTVHTDTTGRAEVNYQLNSGVLFEGAEAEILYELQLVSSICKQDPIPRAIVPNTIRVEHAK